jgi:hypothetical protein
MSVTLDRAFPVARKTHRCTSGGCVIKVGERYHRWKGTTDVTEGIMTLKECRECFERYVFERYYLSPENLAIAEAWLGRKLPHVETEGVRR